jgi:hypothetical protein
MGQLEMSLHYSEWHRIGIRVTKDNEQLNVSES